MSETEVYQGQPGTGTATLMELPIPKCSRCRRNAYQLGPEAKFRDILLWPEFALAVGVPPATIDCITYCEDCFSKYHLLVRGFNAGVTPQEMVSRCERCGKPTIELTLAKMELTRVRAAAFGGDKSEFKQKRCCVHCLEEINTLTDEILIGS